MSYASSNRTAVRIVKESTFGVTPTSPTLIPVRYSGESLSNNITNVTSKEIRDDRMTADLIQVSGDASGDISIEMSFGSYDEFIEGAMASVFSTALALTATDIDASSADDSFNSTASGFVNVVDGQFIRVTGFSNSANNGVFKVTTATTAKLIVVGTLVTEAVGPSVTVKAKMIRNGVTQSSFTVQKHLQDPTTPTFFNYTGTRVGSMSLDFQTGSVVTGSFGLMSLAAADSTSQISGATVAAASTSIPMNASSDLSAIYIDGVISTTKFANLKFELDNKLRAQAAIGSGLSNIGIALGTLSVGGSSSFYFEDSTMYAKYIAGTSFSMSFVIQDDNSDTYVVTLPKQKFGTGKVVSGGLDSDMMFDADWTAVLDSATACMVQIDKL